MPKMHECAQCGRDCPAKYKFCNPECVKAARDARKPMLPAPPPAPDPPTPAATLASDRDLARVRADLKDVRARYKEALETVEAQAKTLSALNAVGEGVETFHIEPHHSSGTAEAVAVLVASDWHIEERVAPNSVSGLNTFDLAIGKKRATAFFQRGLRLIKLLQQDVKIDTVALPLLGDFITNDIHDEMPENNLLLPIDAIIHAEGLLISGIDFLLANTTCKFILNCHSGNHARTTRTTRFATENGHSLEYMMYRHLAAYYRSEPRLQFVIPEGPHSYLDIYSTTIRFQHGHMVKYGGGVGGIYIPVNKAIAQWNKARHADLDVFGHFHQCRDGGNFVCNGSLIGYNAFALSIKADFEPPKQQLFLIDKKRGRTCTWPILL